MRSIGKWALVPRNLYTWTARKDSEYRKGNDSKFHENFSIAFDKCKDSLYEPIYDYNSCYKELSSLLIENNFKNFSGISIISPWISEERKNRILEIYPDKNVAFNSYSGSDLYSIIANYTLSGDSLVQILEEIKLNNNFKFITWNYDLQLEESFNLFLSNNYQKDLNSINNYFKYKYNNLEINDIFHLNGYRGFYETDAENENILNDSFDFEKYWESIEPFYNEVKRKNLNFNNHIKYAWEHNLENNPFFENIYNVLKSEISTLLLI
jgi:hypothetical protein